MSATAQSLWAIDQFLAWEREQSGRHEFIGDCVYAMAPARVGHARAATRITSALLSQIQAPCEVVIEGPLLIAAGDAMVPDV